MAEISAVYNTAETTTYFRELALFIAKSYIANTLSKCEIKTIEGGKEVHNELYYALNVSPNPNQNGSQFINQLIENYYTNGHALVVPFSGSRLYCADGFVIDKQPLKDHRFCNIVIDEKQIQRIYKASEVFYFRLDNTEVSTLIKGLYGSYGKMIASALQAYERANGKKYKLMLENYRAGDEQFRIDYENVIKKQLEAFMNNPNVVYPQFKGTNLEEIGGGGTASSADVINIRKEIFDTTAQAFKIPQSMMYGNITNMNEIVKVYLSICIDPLADMLSEELTRKTNTFETWKAGNRVVVDTSCINHVDILEAADAVSKAIGSGAVNIDEIRERLGKEALNTEFSAAYWMTKNYSRAESVLNEME